ncbi:MAG: hypothetical protein R3252_04675 [Robiginitalea sp.]|nr:hypothetical protein [Robiginitalea sp.]
MESNPSNESGIRSIRKRVMERDLQFIYFLLNAPVYKGQSPNLYERLRQYGTQAGEMEERLRQLGPEQEAALLELEIQLADWKAGVYEFLESKI